MRASLTMELKECRRRMACPYRRVLCPPLCAACKPHTHTHTQNQLRCGTCSPRQSGPSCPPHPPFISVSGLISGTERGSQVLHTNDDDHKVQTRSSLREGGRGGAFKAFLSFGRHAICLFARHKMELSAPSYPWVDGTRRGGGGGGGGGGGHHSSIPTTGRWGGCSNAPTQCQHGSDSGACGVWIGMQWGGGRWCLWGGGTDDISTSRAASRGQSFAWLPSSVELTFLTSLWEALR